LVVDHSGSMAAKQLEVIEGAQAFVQASNPQDREFVVNFNSTVSFPLPENVAFTSNPDVLRAALSTPSASGKTALYDALAAAMEHFQSGEADKRVLLLISDGGDNASKNSFSQVFQMTQTANVMIYAIGLFDEHSADQNPKVLKKLAEETGGQAYFPTSLAQIVSVCREIAAEIRHQYTLGYSPADSGRSGYRKIHVSVTAPGRGKLSVRTRTGYFSPPPKTLSDCSAARTGSMMRATPSARAETVFCGGAGAIVCQQGLSRWPFRTPGAPVQPLAPPPRYPG
jgi:Ca-activated chloride channel family protein